MCLLRMMTGRSKAHDVMCLAHSKPLINICSLPLSSSGTMYFWFCHPRGDGGRSFPRFTTCARGSCSSSLFILMELFTLWEGTLVLSVSGPSSRNCPTKARLFFLSYFLHLSEDSSLLRHIVPSIRPPFPWKDSFP